MLTPLQLLKFADLASKHSADTPYMLTDLSILQDRCREFKKQLPRIKLYYAVKAFNDDAVLEAVDELVDGYDIASTTEIKQLIKLGVRPERITFSNPVKSEAALREAKKLGVNSFAFQSQNELVKIKKNVGQAKVYLRLKVSDQASELSFSSKFGAAPEEALGLLQKAHGLGLEVIGLTFHVGSQAANTGVWDKALALCERLIKQAADAGVHLTVINLGGGFPVQYTKEDPSFRQTARAVQAAVNKHLPKDIDLIAEPGRFICAESSVIVSTIIGVEERDGKTWLFIDTGAFQSFIEIFEFGYFPYPVYSLDHLLHNQPAEHSKEYVLTGPSCDSFDTMSTSVNLPGDLAIGSQLLITMTGAYTVVYGSNFNGFPVPLRHHLKA